MANEGKVVVYNPDGSVKEIRNPTEQEQLELNTSTQFERQLEVLRIERNAKLAETDWTANSDVTMSAEMTTYRQALRDITNGLTTVEDVEAVVFPEKPEV